MSDEEVVMKLIVPSGNAKSFAIRAIAAARRGDFREADARLKQADDAINTAHEFQSAQIRKMLDVASAEPISLVMAHGQDHLMNAITTLDLSRQIIELCRGITQCLSPKPEPEAFECADREHI